MTADVPGASVGVQADETIGADETVEVKLRRLRAALRRYRADLTQKAAADALGWSQSKLVRIELGTVPVTPADVRALLSLYKVTDEQEITRLVGFATAAREGKGFSQYADAYSAESILLFGNEPSATAIYKYEPYLVPGLFQTERYAQAVLGTYPTPADVVKRRLEVRLMRQELLTKPKHPDLNFIIGEAALTISAGGDDVMREQLQHLIDLVKDPRISLQVIPFSAGVHPGLGDSFTVLVFDDETLADLLYLENPGRQSVSRDDEAEIRKYRDRFGEMQKYATKPEDAESVLRQIMESRFGTARSGADVADGR